MRGSELTLKTCNLSRITSLEQIGMGLLFTQAEPYKYWTPLGSPKKYETLDQLMLAISEEVSNM